MVLVFILFIDYPAALHPGCGPMRKFEKLDLDPGLGRSAHRVGAYLRLHGFFQGIIYGKPGEVCDVFLFAIVVNIGLSERRIAMEPEQLESPTVPPDQGLYLIQHPIC